MSLIFLVGAGLRPCLADGPPGGGGGYGLGRRRGLEQHLGERSYTAPIGSLSSTLDVTFFAVSDPTRRGILERLGRGRATLSQLAAPAGLTLNGIKKHVAVLEGAGLVETEKVGRVRECRLGSVATLDQAGEWIAAHRRDWDDRLDRFERFVDGAG